MFFGSFASIVFFNNTRNMVLFLKIFKSNHIFVIFNYKHMYMCLIPVKLFIVRTILCVTVQTCTPYITITVIIIAQFTILNTQLFARSVQRRFSNHACFLYTPLHTRLAEFLLTVACFVLACYSPTQSA